uniref:WRKY19-like zinc finger domain-containing protein n=1 Tax=Attheya septentrionalis TaxID=420275 RepID=A0A7S2UPA2_9STRA|mmetsp:Transcript_6905/g.12402  ORF Transcript_6905/g.12402 Transcript_6905/m.12402 type:complete len:770 (+) Transcript_6905:306-2615(+)
MNNSNDDLNGENDKISNIFLNKGGGSSGLQANFADASHGNLTIPDSQMSSSSTLSQLSKPILPPVRQERLEEFISAFLGMSVFDVADVWMPTSGDDAQYLRHVMSVTASDQNETLNEFKKATTGSILKIWSGAVGKAYGSGNAVWTNKQDAFVDDGRSSAFAMANIKTALAVPIFSDGVFTPACVLCCYSLVRTDSVPFVLRFVQQALRLVWMGLDQVEPHESVGKDLWKDVAPADLGEMAADMEMQQAFMVGKQKRTHDDISSSSRSLYENEEVREIGNSSSTRDRSSSLALQLQTLNTGSTSTPLSAYSPGTDVPVMAPEATAAAPVTVPAELVESHVQRAISSLRDAIPWSMYQHIATKPDGSKRAHTLSNPSPNVTSQSPHIMQHRGFEPVLLQPLPQPMSLPSRAPNSMSHTSFVREPVTQQGYSFQPGQRTLSHANHSGVEQHFFPLHALSINPTSVEVAPPKEDPAVARANIEAFNAMARMQNTGNAMNAPHQVQTTSVNAPFWLEQSFEAGATGFQSRSNVQNFSHGNFQPNDGNNSVPENVFSSSNGFCLPTQGLTHHNSAPSKPTGKTCRIHGCDCPTVSRRPYCLQHSGNRLCENEGCSKCAQGSTRFCIAHGGGRRCTFPGCDKGARDKFFCAAHGGGKRCSQDGCTKSAVGGSSLCTSHGGGRRCAIDGCEKSAQSSTKFCVKHGGGKKCSNPECDKVARGKTLFCAAHGGGVRCKLEGCNRVAIGKLTLCRAHGGGTKSRSESKRGSPKLPPINA